MGVPDPSQLRCWCPWGQEAAPAPSQGCNLLRAQPATLCKSLPIRMPQQSHLSQKTLLSRRLLGDVTVENLV